MVVVQLTPLLFRNTESDSQETLPLIYPLDANKEFNSVLMSIFLRFQVRMFFYLNNSLQCSLYCPLSQNLYEATFSKKLSLRSISALRFYYISLRAGSFSKIGRIDDAQLKKLTLIRFFRSKRQAVGSSFEILKNYLMKMPSWH